jgi:heptosyltransferase-3
MSNETWPKINAKSFLIVCFRYIGDVLMTTPLAYSIKTAFPDADIDYLVFQGTDKAIAKNTHIRKIITVPKSENNIGILFKLFRSYDVAIAANVSDRTLIAAAIAGKQTLGLTYGRNGDLWKHFLLDAQQTYNDRLHAVSSILSMTFQMGIPAIPRVVMGYDNDDVEFVRSLLPAGNFMLLHPYSMKRCKYWPAERWGKLAALIQQHTDCVVIFTATPSPDDNAFLDEILRYAPKGVISFPCSLTQFAAALSGCTAYIGIDTAATHIAAALDVPVVALFGPTLTRYWAPWPNDCRNPSPFIDNKGIQRKEYVTVVQKDWECVPCNKETCTISKRNKMECLEEITPEEVFREVMDNVSKHYHK